MKLFPQSAAQQLEFDKIQDLLFQKCGTEYARERARTLPIHIRRDIIEEALRHTHEFKGLLQHGIYFPLDFVLNLGRELKLLSIAGAVLTGEQLVQFRKLAQNAESIFRWFDAERRTAHPALARVIEGLHYEKKILLLINEVIDEGGVVLDTASPELMTIRTTLYRRRNELRRVFDRIVGKLNKLGYLADIEESFLNGRRVVAVFAEQKRAVRGILHGESESRRTSFIEPEETIELNNSVFELEVSERKEVERILRSLTQRLSGFASLLTRYHEVLGEYDFIRAKASLAMDYGGEFPELSDKAGVHLINAVHPLLYLYNRKAGKRTVPVNLTLDEKSRILVVSGPNAGGKTVTMKTVGLQQLMLQSGLLVPVAPGSRFGIFKQLMIHIGDTQSLEFELSTYSAHLLSMKEFMEWANGRTLFFIDELGSGSDPNLGGAFAEVIMEELARKHAVGIVTTHYLNLKVMAGKTPGIINGAMAFDERTLMPLYQLTVGKPGSSYTFSIAERIGLEKRLIERARSLVDADHFRLDKLLNRTEQDLQRVQHKDRELQALLKENSRLKKEMETVMDRERHRQQVEVLKEQNKVTEERLQYLKDTERKLRQMVGEWKRTEDKEKAVKAMASLLFPKSEKAVASKKAKVLDQKWEEVQGDIKVGDKVKMKRNLQVGEVLELRGKRAVVKIGMLPMQVDLESLVPVREKDPPAEA